MKKIDAHAHIGYIGGWANVGINEEELIRQMDEFEIERTALCCEDNRITADVMNAHPDRIIGCIYVNPLNPADCRLHGRICGKGAFSAVKTQSAQTCLLRRWGCPVSGHGKSRGAGTSGLHTQRTSSLFTSVADRPAGRKISRHKDNDDTYGPRSRGVY